MMCFLQLIEHIEATGMKEEGILRIPGSVTRVNVCNSIRQPVNFMVDVGVFLQVTLFTRLVIMGVCLS